MTVLLRDASGDCWLRFDDPVRIVQATRLSDILPTLREIEVAVHEQDLYAAGFLAYEAAPAFDACLHVRPDADFPLLWFGLYREPERITDLPVVRETLAPLDWVPSLSQEDYRRAIDRIMTYIHAGDTYQVNFTFRLRAEFRGQPMDLFRQISTARSAPYAAFVDTEHYAMCSASPELFIDVKDGRITSRPMKGTAPRGRTLDEDRRLSTDLLHSPKNRAENVMIVDMIRNDLGRVAKAGSVVASDLYTIEKYPTVWQMTSTVTGKTNAPLTEILKATFPCSSITGAPKPRTMEIIAELEQSPRKIYTGSIGFVAPNGRARFNVAIRTALVDKRKHQVEYGVGGGIVWDSRSDDEFTECHNKARILFDTRPDFDLLETLLWDPDNGYHLLDRHLARLAESAEYFSFPLDPHLILKSLQDLTRSLPPHPHRVRLLLGAGGTPVTEATLATTIPKAASCLSLAQKPVDRSDPFLYHKTTNRRAYARALAMQHDPHDVILWNERSEVTESCIANIIVELDGQRYTPPVECGLLCGTQRSAMLEKGLIKEKVISLAELHDSDCVSLINSVRGEWKITVRE